MPIRHSYQTATADDPGSEVSASEWNADHQITDSVDFPVITSAPSGATDVLKLFAQRRANRSLLRQVGQNGIDVTLQPAFFGNSIGMWLPSTGTTIGVFGLAAVTALNSGTSAAVSTPTVGTGSDIASMRRFAFGTGTTATGTSGARDASAHFFRGNAAGRGGFFQFARFAVETFASDIRVILGLTNNTAALAGDPSALVNMCGIGKDSADANWQFMHNDGSGTATKSNTGVAVNATDILDFFMFAPPNGTTIDFELRNAMTGAQLATYQATTDLPVNSTTMVQRAGIMSVSGTTAKLLSVNRMYIETDL
ncbi:hypothetical protein [Microcystis phage Mel-JY03]